MRWATAVLLKNVDSYIKWLVTLFVAVVDKLSVEGEAMLFAYFSTYMPPTVACCMFVA